MFEFLRRSKDRAAATLKEHRAQYRRLVLKAVMAPDGELSREDETLLDASMASLKILPDELEQHLQAAARVASLEKIAAELPARTAEHARSKEAIVPARHELTKRLEAAKQKILDETAIIEKRFQQTGALKTEAIRAAEECESIRKATPLIYDVTDTSNLEIERPMGIVKA